MKQKQTLVLFTFIFLCSCGQAPPLQSIPTETGTPMPIVTRTPTPTLDATPTTLWDGLLSHEPISYLETPLAPAQASPIDGLYGRLLDIPPQWWRCLRCADYRIAGGLWRLQFDKGVMRIYYALNSWRAIASFTVEGDRLFIFNDSTCIQPGEYKWSLANGSLHLEPVGEDNCYFGLRGKNLSDGNWQLCPADRNAPDAPLGCGDRAHFEPLEAADLPVSVTVRQGDSRIYDPPLDLIVAANKDNIPAPEGVLIESDPETLEYGTNRVLWWGGNWIQATTALPYTSMGVQFYGSSTIGWASVFFDGVEVWRGDVAKIWNHFGGYGGFVEVSGYEPGEHTIRVELVEGDYSPLTVAVFGFDN
jgi:hypothetical protein